MKGKWKNLRDSYRRCIKNIYLKTRSGAGNTKLPTCKQINTLRFLRDSIENRKTESNLQLPTTSNIKTSNTSLSSASISPISPPTPLINHRSKTLDSHQKKLELENVNKLISKVLVDDSKENEDPDYLFCRRLVPILRGLPPKENRLLKMDLQKLCFKYEFGEEE